MSTSLVGRPAEAQTRRRLAVLVLGSGGLDPATADSLTEVLIAAIVARGGVEVVGKEEFQSQLGTDEAQSRSCLDSSSCLGRVGVELGVDEVVAGSVGPRRGGGGFTMSLNRIEIATTDVRGRVFRQIEGDEQALVAAIQRAASELYEERERSGGLRVTANTEGAEVYVDDERRGVAPLTLPDVAPGGHRVRVEKRGHQSWSTEVRVEAGATAEVAADLAATSRPEEEEGRPASGLAIALTIVGGALTIAGGAGAYFFGTSSQEAPTSHRQTDAAEELDTKEDEALYANVAFGVGGAALLFTTYMLVFQSDAVFGTSGPEDDVAVGVVPLASGGAASVRARW